MVDGNLVGVETEIHMSIVIERGEAVVVPCGRVQQREP